MIQTIALVFLVISINIGLFALKIPQIIQNRAATPNVVLAVNPSLKSCTSGETFPLQISLDTGTASVTAVELHLTYDPTAVEVLSFTPGSPLPVILAPAVFANGSLSVTLGVQPTSPFNGVGFIGS